MASIVVAGDTSGTISLTAPAVAGTTTLTLPTTSGTLITTGGGAAGSFTTLTSTQGTSFATSSGNVGIGTTSPSNKLDVFNSNFGGSNASLILSSVNSASAKINYVGLGYETSQGAAGIEAGSMLFYTYGSGSLSERMRIDASGAVGIGTTNIPTTNALLVKSNYGSATMRVYNTSGTNTYLVSWHNSTQECGTITTGNNTVGYNSNSDYRLKDNVIPMTGALDKVAQLKPVTYTWKIDGSNGQGFIAHELQEHFPDAVSGEKDAVDEEGKPIYQGVDTSFLVATLTAAIQELTARVKELEAKVK